MIDLTDNYQSMVKEMGGERKAPRSLSGASRFWVAATQIFSQLDALRRKIEAIEDLCSGSLFEQQDRTRAKNLAQLTQLVKKDLSSLKAQLDALEAYAGSERQYRVNDETSQHVSMIVQHMRGVLLGEYSRRFQKSLERRTDALRRQQQQEAEFNFGARERDDEAMDAQLASFEHDTWDDGQVADDGVGGEVEVRIPSMMDREVSATESYQQSRTEAVLQIEQTLTDVQRMFGRMGELAAVQNEAVMRIDANIMDTQHNVESAQEELMKYLQSLQGNRWLIAKIFSILMVFGVIFFVLL